MGPAEGGLGGVEGFDVGDVPELLFDGFAFVRADASGADVDERDGGQLFGGAVTGDSDYLEVGGGRHAGLTWLKRVSVERKCTIAGLMQMQGGVG